MNNDIPNGPYEPNGSRPAQSIAPTCAEQTAENCNQDNGFAHSTKRDLAHPPHSEHLDDPLGIPMTISEVARLLRCSIWTIRQRYLRSGLPHFRIGRSGKLLFYRKQVVQWILANHTTKGGEAQ